MDALSRLVAYESDSDDDYDDDCFVFFALVGAANGVEPQHIHSRYRKTYYRMLNARARQLRDRRIPRAALLLPMYSSWCQLYDSKNNQALITAAGVDHETFSYLLEKFKPAYDSHVVDKETYEVRERKKKGGRPRLLDASGCLGMTLMWTRTRGAEWNLGMLFGTTGTPTSLWLRFGRRILLDVLRSEAIGKIEMPNETDIVEYKDAVARRHPILGEEGVYGAMDGLKLYLQCAGDNETQETFYNGWTCDHYVTNLFLFVPDGTIALAIINCPGNNHDSTLASKGGVYTKIAKVYERDGGKVAVDSAFAAEDYDGMIKSAQTIAFATSCREVLIVKEATAMRQSSEWGMRGLQGSFPRLKDRFIYEERGERGLMLEMVCRLYNVRARRVGMNQIQSVYMPWLDRSAHEIMMYGS